MTMALWGDFGDQNGQNGMVVANFPMVANEAQAQDQLEQSLRQQGKGKQALVERKSEDRSFKIHGKEAEFQFTHGKDATTKAPRLEVTGMFEGAKGNDHARGSNRSEERRENCQDDRVDQVTVPT